MLFSENRYPHFRIMLQQNAVTGTPANALLEEAPRLTPLLCGASALRPGWRIAAAEQPREEVAAPGARGVTIHRHSQRFATGGVGAPARTIDRALGNLALVAFEDRDRGAVAAVHVLAEFQLALVVDKRRLVGQMHRQVMRELDVLLAHAADHFTNAVRGVALT